MMRQHCNGLALSLLGIVCACILPAACFAHPARFASAELKIDRNRTVHLSLRFDLLAYMVDDSPERVSDTAMMDVLQASRQSQAQMLADAQGRLARGCLLVTNDGTIRLEATAFPTAAQLPSGFQGARSLPMMGEAELQGVLPLDCQSTTVRFPEVLGPVVLVVEVPGLEASSIALSPAQTSEPIALPTVVKTPDTRESPVSSAASRALAYLRLGFTHIVPNGPDHVFFVLGLFLLSTQWRPLLYQVTAFTLAHSLTLGLSLWGAVSLPSHIVEPLIAVSIAWIAVENLLTNRLNPWRPAIVFLFGLVHGLGFAGALRETPLPHADFLLAVGCFNAGIELGQLTVIASAVLLVGWFRQNTWYRRAIVCPASLAIACVAMFWAIQRTF